MPAKNIEFDYVPYISIAPGIATFYERPDKQYFTDNQRQSFLNLSDNENISNDLSEHSAKRLRRKLDFMMFLSTSKSVRGNKLISKQQNYTTLYQKGDPYPDLVNFKLTFITLTLPAPQRHTDEEIKAKCLNQLLTELRQSFNVKLYIWKAEKQDNGNIHFHILCDHYIPWRQLRSIWNRIVEKLEYVTDYQNRMLNYFKNGFKLSTNKSDTRDRQTQYLAYITGKKENWRNPNSTDIHALYKVNNVQAYMTKYLTKGTTKTNRRQEINRLTRAMEHYNEIMHNNPTKSLSNNFFNNRQQTIDQLRKLQNSGISGRIWGCSQVLSKLTNFIEVGYGDDIPELKTAVEHPRRVMKYEFGNSTVTSYFYDQSKFSQLSKYLEEQIYNKLNQSQIES